MAYSKNPAIEKSLHYSLKDAVAYSIMTGGIETYFSAFAIFLAVSTPQIALLSTAPNMIGALAQILSAWLGHRLNQRKPIIVWGAYAQAASLLVLFCMTYLIHDHAFITLFICLTFYFASAHLIAPQWMSLMGDLVPERKRGRFFAHRTRLSSITSFTALLMAGALLHVLDIFNATLAGFALLFLIAFVARLVSAYNLLQMEETSHHGACIETFANLGWLGSKEFQAAKRFSVFFILMQFSVGLAGPFFSVYMLRDLHFSYLEFMANTGMVVLTQFWSLIRWGRVSDVLGNRSVLRTTGSIIPLLPLFWIFSSNFWYLLLVQLIAGFAWAGFSLSAGNILYDLIPKEKRATYQALQNVLVTIGAFCGGLISTLLLSFLPEKIAIGNWDFQPTSPLIWAFLLSSIMRIVISTLFLPRIQEQRKVKKTISTHELVFRVTRFNVFMDLMYEIVARLRKQNFQEFTAAPLRSIKTDSFP